MKATDIHDIAQAFDGEAARYQRFSNHPVAAFMRRRTHDVYRKYLKKGDRILDLHCGTGDDLPFLGTLSNDVTAIDCSQEMLAKAAEKATCRFLCMDANRLLDLNESFDAICSNFGGLNTQRDCSLIAEGCKKSLNPGGMLLLTMMSPYPMLEIIHGMMTGRHFFRRLRHNGAPLRVGDRHINTYYFAPKRWYRRYFAEAFELCAMIGLGIFLPPPYLSPPPAVLSRMLHRLERLCGKSYPWNRLGDHTMLVMRARG